MGLEEVERCITPVVVSPETLQRVKEVAPQLGSVNDINRLSIDNSLNSLLVYQPGVTAENLQSSWYHEYQLYALGIIAKRNLLIRYIFILDNFGKILTDCACLETGVIFAARGNSSGRKIDAACVNIHNELGVLENWQHYQRHNVRRYPVNEGAIR